jgi:polyphosphate kinase
MHELLDDLQNGEMTDLPVMTETPMLVPRAVAPQPVPKRASLDHPSLYFNRELSWLDFNWRVLYQALDERNPLLERVRFLSIAANNLDEFFRKRMGGLKRQVAARVLIPSLDGRSPEEQLALTRAAVRPMHEQLAHTWQVVLHPLLRTQLGMQVHDYAALSAEQQRRLHAWFLSHLFPILTPLAVDPGHPFPFISNMSLSLAVSLRHPKRQTGHFARIKVPMNWGRFIPLDEPLQYVPVEQVIAHNVHELFRGMKVEGVSAFRVTRNADIQRAEEEADDLIAMIAEELRERRFAPVVRLEVEQNTSQDMCDFLTEELLLEPGDVFRTNGLLDLAHVATFANLDFPQHQYEPWEPVTPVRMLHEGEAKDRPNVFRIIRGGDVLVHHPYESFRGSVQRFIEEAVLDPQVIAIKQTLYRTSDESPVVGALIRAAEQGKQVAVLVEVKARFDEENNIEWAQKLEKSGVHVTYGLVGLKTHTKTTLVIRQEEDGLRAYCHIGTGNYNPKTARLYTDFGLFTCKKEIGSDLVNLFHYLTGYAPEQHYHKLLVAPRDMRTAFLRLIRQEVEHQKQHGNGRIIAKMNALDDVEIIQELYRASKAGVKIDLIIRGICRLRPGVPRFSEHIRVISILGRFLEHSRIYYFGNGTNGKDDHDRIFIGSGDWMRRNLEDRVEVAVEIKNAEHKMRLRNTLSFALADQRSAWELNAEGYYILRQPRTAEEQEGYQEVLMRRARERVTELDTPWDIL